MDSGPQKQLLRRAKCSMGCGGYSIVSRLGKWQQPLPPALIFVTRLGMVQDLQTLKVKILLAINDLKLWICLLSSTHSWWNLTAHHKSCQLEDLFRGTCVRYRIGSAIEYTHLENSSYYSVNTTEIIGSRIRASIPNYSEKSYVILTLIPRGYL